MSNGKFTMGGPLRSRHSLQSNDQDSAMHRQTRSFSSWMAKTQLTTMTVRLITLFFICFAKLISLIQRHLRPMRRVVIVKMLSIRV